MSDSLPPLEVEFKAKFGELDAALGSLKEKLEATEGPAEKAGEHFEVLGLHGRHAAGAMREVAVTGVASLEALGIASDGVAGIIQKGASEAVLGLALNVSGLGIAVMATTAVLAKGAELWNKNAEAAKKSAETIEEAEKKEAEAIKHAREELDKTNERIEAINYAREQGISIQKSEMELHALTARAVAEKNRAESDSVHTAYLAGQKNLAGLRADIEQAKKDEVAWVNSASHTSAEAKARREADYAKIEEEKKTIAALANLEGSHRIDQRRLDDEAAQADAAIVAANSAKKLEADRHYVDEKTKLYAEAAKAFFRDQNADTERARRDSNATEAKEDQAWAKLNKDVATDTAREKAALGKQMLDDAIRGYRLDGEAAGAVEKEKRREIEESFKLRQEANKRTLEFVERESKVAADAIANVAEQALSGDEAAMNKFLQQQAKKDAIRAAEEGAEALAAVAFGNIPSAVAHGTAAAEFAAIAGASAIGAAATGGFGAPTPSAPAPGSGTSTGSSQGGSYGSGGGGQRGPLTIIVQAPGLYQTPADAGRALRQALAEADRLA